jgi:hypothetical protein
MLEYSKEFKKPKVIWLGDSIDCVYLMKKDEGYKTWKSRPEGIEEFFIPKLDEEILWMKDRLDTLQETFETVYVAGGNHDQWRIYDFQQSRYCPHAYKHYFDLPELLELDKRKIPFINYNEYYDLGENLTLTHGYAHGTRANHKHYYDAQKSIIFGHVHQASMVPFASRGHSHLSISLPCMTSTRADYARNTPNNHSQGFGQVNLRADNIFHYYHHLVWNDKLVLPNGKVV